MWLAVVAPVVTQLLAQAERVQAVSGLISPDRPSMKMLMATSMDMSMGMSDSMSMHMATSTDNHGDTVPHADHGHDSAPDHGNACAYCGFLADHLPISSLSSLTFDSVFPLSRVLFLAAESAILARCYNAARPRAPPVPTR